MKEMKQSSVAVLIGIVFLLVGIEVLLIYIACTTQTSEDITFEDRDVNKNTTDPTTTTSASTTSTNTTRASTTSTNTTRASTTTVTSSTLTKTTETSVTTRTTASTTTSQSTLPSKTTTDKIITVSSTQFTTTSTQSSLSSLPPPVSSLPPSVSSLPPPVSSLPPSVSSLPPSVSSFLPPCVCNLLSPKTSHSITTNVTKTKTNTTKTTIRRTAFKKQNFASMFSPLTMNKTTNTSIETNTTEIFPIFPFTTLISTIASLPTPSSTTMSPLLIMAATTKENKPYSKIIIPKFNYVLRNEEGVACVLANMTIHIYLQHMKDSQIQKFTVPTDAIPTGICAERTNNMTLSWEESAKNQVNSNKITFNYVHDDSKFFLDSIFVDVHLRDSIKMTGNTRRLKLFSAAIKDGIFTCKVNIRINVESRINVDISNIYLIAFNKCSGNCTKTETNCILETVKTIAIVGIIIVAIVLALILFVLYLPCYIQKKPILEDSKTS